MFQALIYVEVQLSYSNCKVMFVFAEMLKIPGGVLGPAVEQKLLGVLELDNRMEQYDTIHRYSHSYSQHQEHMFLSALNSQTI